VDGRVTQLLRRASAGDAAASEELLPIVYTELHRLATSHMRRERLEHTLQPTALVNEAYLKIVGHANAEFPDRARFLAFASRLMRTILVDHARARNSSKRGGGAQHVQVDTGLEIAVDDAEADRVISLLDLNVALDELSAQHPHAADAIEMRYFGGMTAEETATVVGRSVHVVQHDLRFARAWLGRRLSVR
jgi:RNA polymerase sigma factor (TIGR02999 family)